MRAGLGTSPGARRGPPLGAPELHPAQTLAGEALQIGPERINAHAALHLDATQDWPLHNLGNSPLECLLLQGRPLGEPVVQHGPFVMNTREEIMQAMHDYRRTGFGGWPWATPDPTHGPTPRRFARHPGATHDELPPQVPPPPPGAQASPRAD